jgi:hypothetical protein
MAHIAERPNKDEFLSVSLGYKKFKTVSVNFEGDIAPDDIRAPRPVIIEVSMPKQATKEQISKVLAKEGKYRLLTGAEETRLTESEMCTCETCGKRFLPPKMDWCRPGVDVMAYTSYCAKCR